MNREENPTFNSEAYPNRRTALKQSGIMALAASGALAASLPSGKNVVAQEKKEQAASKPSKDEQALTHAGFNEKEYDCWVQTAKAAAAFMKLEVLHPRDLSEVEKAIHVIQNKLLSRPTYRKYVGFHKANEGK